MKKSLLVLTLAISPVLFAQKADDSKQKSKVKYISQVSLNFLGGEESAAAFHVKNGLALSPHFNATLGLGIENYNLSSRFMPIFLDFKYNVLDRKTTPFISVSSGYLLPFTHRSFGPKAKSGFTGGAKIGVSHFFSEHIGLETSLGYRFSKVEIEQNGYSYFDIYTPNYTTEYNMNRFELSVGLIFK